jgi:hypothetical protein
MPWTTALQSVVSHAGSSMNALHGDPGGKVQFDCHFNFNY